jgi:hypothetical protein
MPIIDLQRSVRQVGRIRLGEQTPTSNGRARPVKLETFRLSSPQRGPIERAAQLYGGTVKEMTSDRSDDRWEVTTQADSLPVVIPPTNHLSQWYELWSGAGCDRRCDGQEAIVLDGRPTTAECVCDPANRQCQATTRLSVILPELEALGVWRLDSKGYYAAIELAGTADLCAVATRHGYSIPARLDLEQRTRRTRDQQGKPQTYKFAVPVLSVDVSLPQAKAILGQADVATGEIATPSTRQLEAPAPRAIEPAPPAPAPRAELPPPPPADIPTPRTHDQYEADQDLPPDVISQTQVDALVAVFDGIADEDARRTVKREFIDVYGRPDEMFVDEYDAALRWAESKADQAGTPPTPVEVVEQPKLVDTLPGDGHARTLQKGADRFTVPQQRKFFKLWGDLSKVRGWTEEDRAARIKEATAGRTSSWADVTQIEAKTIIAALEDLEKGTA